MHTERAGLLQRGIELHFCYLQTSKTLFKVDQLEFLSAVAHCQAAGDQLHATL